MQIESATVCRVDNFFHSESIFRLLLKVAVEKVHKCEHYIFRMPSMAIKFPLPSLGNTPVPGYAIPSQGDSVDSISRTRSAGPDLPDLTARTRHAGPELPDSICRAHHPPDSIRRPRSAGPGSPCSRTKQAPFQFRFPNFNVSRRNANRVRYRLPRRQEQ